MFVYWNGIKFFETTTNKNDNFKRQTNYSVHRELKQLHNFSNQNSKYHKIENKLAADILFFVLIRLIIVRVV